jgi:type II secretory pathway pseudopilin PulG
MPDPAPAVQEKLFGKYQEVVLLVLGFGLTTLVGGFLADRVQRRTWLQQHQIQTCETEQQARTQGFAQLSDRMDTRLLRMRELAWALEHAKILKEVDTERKLNREVRDEWSSRVNSSLAFTEVYFGENSLNTLNALDQEFGQIFESFNPIFNSGKPDPEAAKQIETAIDRFNPKVYAFDLSMEQAIQAKSGTCAASEPK